MKKATPICYLLAAMLVFIVQQKNVYSQTKHASKISSFNGTKTIGATGADYTTLTAALAAANSAVLDGPVIFSLQADYTSTGETFPLTIGNIAGSSATNTITIRPAVTGLSITSNNTTATVYLNGAKYITIDGRVNGIGTTKDLVITNTSTATGGTAIKYINDASNNTIKYAKLSSSYGANGTGVIYFSTTTGSTGNDNNTIDNCDIDGKAGSTASPVTAGTAAIGVYSSGSETTSETYNSGNTISNCNIFDNFNSASAANFGIYIFSGNKEWTITGNSFYQTSPRTTTVDFIQMNVINIVCATGGSFTITNNYIGGSAANTGGSAMTINGGFTNKFRGISLQVNFTNPSSVQGNTIANINFSSSSNTSAIPGIFAGICVNNGSVNIGTSIGNTIGSATGTGSIVTTTTGSGALTYGICSDAASSVLNISNNTIGSITATGSSNTISSGITGIANTGNTATVTISGNTIGSTSTANSINASTASTSATTQVVTGISNTGSGTHSISNNNISNLNNAYEPSSANNNTILRGIFNSNGSVSISGNTIRNLSTAANATGTIASASVIGISNTSTTTPITISQNSIHTLMNTNSSATSQIIGIYTTSPTTGRNNTSRNFVHSFKLSSSAVGVMYGIYNASGISTCYNNMIRLGIDETGTSLVNAYDIRGIYDASGTHQYYFNSVYLGGTGVSSGSTNTYAFYSAVTSNVRTFQNNIFVNNRSNSSGTALNVAYFISGTLPLPTGLNSNNNLFYANGTGGILIRNSTTNYTLSKWRSDSYLDNASHQGNPNFVSATGTSSTVDLHLQSATMAESSGIAISTITDDYDGNTRSDLSPTDIGADAGSFTSADGSPVTINYPLLNNGGTANKVLTNFATITDNVGISNTSKPRIYYKKSTESDAFIGNTNTDNGWKYVVASNSSSPYSFTLDYSLLNSPIANADVIEYFVVAQDASNNFNSLPEGALYSTNPPVENISSKPSTVNSFSINTSTVSGSINVGTGETYTTLTGVGGLFEFLNTKTLSGNLTINITSDIIEDGVTSLNALGEEPYSNNFSITIQSSSNVTRTISGTAVASGSPMINFNGTDNVMIDGRNGGSGQYLIFRNTNATASNTGAAIQFTNGSINCTLRNCIIETNASSSTRGSVIIGASGVNNITITSNDFRDATAGTTGMPENEIYSNSLTNSISISNNNIYNFSGKGILLTLAADACTISGNSFYATTSGSTSLTCIQIAGGNGHTITGNYMGGTSSNAGGTPLQNNSSYTGISSSSNYISPNSIQNNTIQNINLISTGSFGFVGINVTSGLVNIGTVTGNTIGHSSNTNNITVAGTLGSAGIFISTISQVNISNNLIANITATGTGTSNTLYGVIISSNADNTITNNTIKNLSSAGTVNIIGASRSVAGISTSSYSITQEITKNTIFGLTASHPSSVVGCAGIVASDIIGTFTISKNNIYGLSNLSSNTSASISGIYIDAGSSVCKNNMININNGANTNDPIITGIGCKNATGKTNTIYYNSVRIGGTGSSTTNSYALLREVAEPTMDIKNNIFINERTGGSGKHYAIGNSLSATGWSAGASNYNVLYSATSGTTGYWTSDLSFAGFQSASSSEANSKNVDVVFTDENNGDLHIAGASIGSANLNGVLISSVTEDYDGNTRPSTSGIPYIGADEVTSSPLPIELLDFGGSAKEAFNLLTWTTASEMNSNYFEVERLTNEKAFENIGRINAVGNSRELNHYQFHDNTFSKKNTVDYYRLKLVDNDNRFVYSDVIVIKRGTGINTSLTVYPNPSTDIVNIIVSNTNEASIELKIIDMLGKIMYENSHLKNNEMNAISVSEFPAGLYTIQITGVNENINEKFLKK